MIQLPHEPAGIENFAQVLKTFRGLGRFFVYRMLLWPICSSGSNGGGADISIAYRSRLNTASHRSGQRLTLSPVRDFAMTAIETS